MKSVSVDGNTYLFKKISNAASSTKVEINCILLRQTLTRGYWIVLNNSDGAMNPVFLSFEAVEKLGDKICAERINDLYNEYKKQLEILRESPFYE